MTPADLWKGYDLGTWSREPPTVPGPYYVCSLGQVHSVAFFRVIWEDTASASPAVAIFEGDGQCLRVYPITEFPGALWHPWQPTPPTPPKKAEVDPGPGVWTDKPWREGLHRVRVPGVEGASSADVYVGAHPREDMPVASFFGFPTSVSRYPRGTRWYLYPDPPKDTER